MLIPRKFFSLPFLSFSPSLSPPPPSQTLHGRSKDVCGDIEPAGPASGTIGLQRRSGERLDEREYGKMGKGGDGNWMALRQQSPSKSVLFDCRKTKRDKTPSLIDTSQEKAHIPLQA